MAHTDKNYQKDYKELCKAMFWRKIDFFKHFSFSRSKTNFSKSFFVINDRSDHKMSEPTASNLSPAGELGIAVLNLFLQPRISLVGRKAILGDFVACSSDPFI